MFRGSNPAGFVVRVSWRCISMKPDEVDTTILHEDRPRYLADSSASIVLIAILVPAPRSCLTQKSMSTNENEEEETFDDCGL